MLVTLIGQIVHITPIAMRTRSETSLLKSECTRPPSVRLMVVSAEALDIIGSSQSFTGSRKQLLLASAHLLPGPYLTMHKLPCCLRSHACQARYASTSATPYPFPSNAQPTPHQIFHLPIGASQQDIKSRCRYLCPYIHISRHAHAHLSTSPCVV